MKSVGHKALLIARVAVLLALGGCCLVDEDLSECGTDLQIDYELRLVTNVSTELKTVLGLEGDAHVADALKTYLAPVFTDFANDVDLSFYDVSEPYQVLEHMSEIMNANQSSYTIYLPSRGYSHTAVANIRDNGSVTLEDNDFLYNSVLRQHTTKGADDNKVSPHRTGIFSTRLDMDVKANLDQRFDVTLYMVNAASALVLDTSEATGVQDVKVFVEGFATEFQVADSTYVFGGDMLVMTEEIPVNDGKSRCFASVHFPSKDPDGTKVIIDSQDPFIAEDAENALWKWRCYITLDDGSITETVLGINKPLRPGGLKILKAKVQDTGIVTTDDPTVGVSVTLDWQDAGHHIIDL